MLTTNGRECSANNCANGFKIARKTFWDVFSRLWIFMHFILNFQKRYINSSNTINSQFFIDRAEQEKEEPQVFRQLTPIGRTIFRLKNASLSGMIRVYRLQTEWPESATRGVPKSTLLPIFGNMCCQIFVQPMSLLQPLAQGALDLYFIDDRLLLQKLSCVLQVIRGIDQREISRVVS